MIVIMIQKKKRFCFEYFFFFWSLLFLWEGVGERERERVRNDGRVMVGRGEEAVARDDVVCFLFTISLLMYSSYETVELS